MIAFRHLLLIPALLCATSAHATQDVSSAVVNAGENTVEWRGDFAWDNESASTDHRYRQRIHYDHGFTDWYAARLITSHTKRDGDHLRNSALTLENRFQIFERKQHGWDGGFRLNYKLADGASKPDEAQLVFLGLFPMETMEYRSTWHFGREVGEDSEPGIQFETRWQGVYKLENKTKIGLEGFHDFGNLRESSGWDNASHQIGPVIMGNLSDSVGYQAGYLHGVSTAAPDHSIKFFLSLKF